METKEDLSDVIFYPGTLDAYQRRSGHDVFEIETHERDKGITFRKGINERAYRFLGSDKLKAHLIQSGIEAIVNCIEAYDAHSGVSNKYGLPVAKKTEKPKESSSY